jgi:hypothetical protein
MYILLIILEIVTATMTSSGGSSHNGTHIPEVTIE